MRRPFLTLILAAGCALAAGSAAAQSWGYNSGHGRHEAGSNRAPSAFAWRSQLDRPGDYRCDTFWDANRTDCGARWRDQRHRVSPQARRDYRALAGYGDNHGYGRPYGHDGRYSTRRRGYGHGYGSYGQAGTVYHGAYGRPDIVHAGGGRGGYGRQDYAGGRDPARIDWCRATWRSYDPASGYYRAWSGRLIFCG